MRPRGAVAALLSTVLIAVWPAIGHAQVEQIAADEREQWATKIKAAYLYKFGGFVEWPAGTFSRSDSPLTIGVMGADAVADELTRMVAQRTVAGRSIAVRRMHRESPVAGVQMLFVGGNDAARIGAVLAETRGRPTLTVTESADPDESADPPDSGGADAPPTQDSMINFVLVDDKVRFDVALPPAEAAHLRISARLLRVARRVVGRQS